MRSLCRREVTRNENKDRNHRSVEWIQDAHASLQAGTGDMGPDDNNYGNSLDGREIVPCLQDSSIPVIAQADAISCSKHRMTLIEMPGRV